jgi:hypothetical protein
VDHVTANRLEAKLVIEGGDPINRRRAHAQMAANLHHRRRGQIANGVLHVLENGDEILSVTGVALENESDLRFLGRQDGSVTATAVSRIHCGLLTYTL